MEIGTGATATTPAVGITAVSSIGTSPGALNLNGITPASTASAQRSAQTAPASPLGLAMTSLASMSLAEMRRLACATARWTLAQGTTCSPSQRKLKARTAPTTVTATAATTTTIPAAAGITAMTTAAPMATTAEAGMATALTTKGAIPATGAMRRIPAAGGLIPMTTHRSIAMALQSVPTAVA